MLDRWHHIRACWGKEGMFLYIDGAEVAHTELPAEIDWFIPNRNFLIGTYDWPGGYDAWYYQGIIDDFKFIPRQERLIATKKSSKEKRSPQPKYNVVIPETVSGVVYNDANRNGIRDPGEKGIANVSVSDGFSVVSTDKEGKYTLTPSKKAVFIQITRPSGYDVVGYWYQPISSVVNFALTKSEKDETKFTFIHVTDTHISTLPACLKGLKDFVEEVNNLNPLPLFVFNTGDLVNCTKQLTTPVSIARAYFNNYTRIMDKLKVPYYNVAGDHTDVGYRMKEFPRGDFRCGKAMFWEYLGPNFFSFEYGKLHFVSLDVIYHLGKNHTHTITPEHLRWLKQDLEHRSPGTIVITGSENTLERSIPEFYELGKKYNIKLQLYGDDHIFTYNDTPIPSRCGGALSGNWWKTKCSDLTPQGYVIYQVEGEKLDCFYKALRKQININAPRFGACVQGIVEIHAHLVQGKSKGPLEYSIDGKNWKPMQETTPSFYRKNYVAKFNSTLFPDGLIKLKIRTKDNSEVEEIPLVIDNNKKGFTAQSDATLKLQISKLIVRNIQPKGEVKVIFNGKEISTVFRQKVYNISIPAVSLKKVNHLSFKFSYPDDGMTMKEPILIYGGKILYDPRQE